MLKMVCSGCGPMLCGLITPMSPTRPARRLPPRLGCALAGVGAGAVALTATLVASGVAGAAGGFEAAGAGAPHALSSASVALAAITRNAARRLIPRSVAWCTDILIPCAHTVHTPTHACA